MKLKKRKVKSEVSKDWQHCCRYCKYYRSGDFYNYCSVLFGVNIETLDSYPLEIENPEEFYCARWE